MIYYQRRQIILSKYINEQPEGFKTYIQAGLQNLENGKQR